MTLGSVASLSFTFLVATVFLLGCSKSSTTQASFGSSSDSSSSPFKSSSSSDGEQEEDAAYRSDVRDYAASFGAADVDASVLQRDLSGIAETHGFTDWESHEGTYLAIGQGLGRAGIESRRFERIAVELAEQDHHRLALLQAGFEESIEFPDER